MEYREGVAAEDGKLTLSALNLGFAFWKQPVFYVFSCESVFFLSLPFEHIFSPSASLLGSYALSHTHLHIMPHVCQFHSLILSQLFPLVIPQTLQFHFVTV